MCDKLGRFGVRRYIGLLGGLDWAFSEFYILEWWNDQIVGCIVNGSLRSQIIGREGIVFF